MDYFNIFVDMHFMKIYHRVLIIVSGSSAHFSAITFKMKLRREVGYYIMDYFLPSILLVCTSWVTFWLQADAAPPRVTLGE